MDDLRQHAPLSALDEYLIHNHPNPVRVMWTTDPRAYERIFFAIHDRLGEVFVAAGLAFYPNLDTAEAFCIVNERGIVRSVHAHRRLGLDRTDMCVGPLAFTIERAFREWRLQIDDNEMGITADLRMFDTARAVYKPDARPLPAGPQLSMSNGYESMIEAAGWVEAGGTRHVMERASMLGTRDHHWGIRDGVGGPGLFQGRTWPISGFWVRIGDWSLWGNRILLDLDDPRPGALEIVDRDHRFEFEPDTGLMLRGEVDLRLRDGSQRQLTFERLGNQIIPLRMAMYGGPRGGTPEGDHWYGSIADDVVLGEVHDLNDPAVRRLVRGLDEMHCRFECDGVVGYGIAEPYHDHLWEACVAGATGFALLGQG